MIAVELFCVHTFACAYVALQDSVRMLQLWLFVFFFVALGQQRILLRLCNGSGVCSIHSVGVDVARILVNRV